MWAYAWLEIAMRYAKAVNILKGMSYIECHRFRHWFHCASQNVMNSLRTRLKILYSRILSALMSFSKSPYSAFSITKATQLESSVIVHTSIVSAPTYRYPKVHGIFEKP